jgi:hypothetical protein
MRSLGKEIPFILAYARSARAPSAQRKKATPKGVRNSRPNLIKMKEQPQTQPRAMYAAIQPEDFLGEAK